MSEQHQEKPDRGIAIRIGVACEGGMTIDMTSIVPDDSTDADLQHRLQTMISPAKAAYAKERLPALRHERDGLWMVLNENRERLVEMERLAAEAASASDDDRVKTRQAHQDIYEAGAREHFASGRQGDFEPRGKTRADLNRLAGHIAQLDTAQKKADDQHLVDHSQLLNEIKKREHSVAILDRQIDECERLARREDISGV